jgi:hypothetical protein
VHCNHEALYPFGLYSGEGAIFLFMRQRQPAMANHPVKLLAFATDKLNTAFGWKSEASVTTKRSLALYRSRATCEYRDGSQHCWQ